MYATRQDMIDRYGAPRMVQLTDVTMPMTNGIIDTVLEARLADASAEIDGYLTGRMVLPLAQPPGILRLLACRIAYLLLLGHAATDADRKDVEAARAYLRDIAQGKVLLQPPDQAAEVPGAGTVQFNHGDVVEWRGV